MEERKKLLLERIQQKKKSKKTPDSYQKILRRLDAEKLSETEYKEKIFEIIGWIERFGIPKNDREYEAITKRIWDYPVFDTIRETMESEVRGIENPPEMISGLIPCRYCKSDKTYSYSVQTRSADEGMTTFCACTSCGKRFRIG